MNNQREIYKALLAGETLINNRGQRQSLNEKGNLRNNLVDMSDSNEWQIYKEPKILCRVGSMHGKERVRLLINYNAETKRGFTESGVEWAKAEPLTKQEIQVFMDNVPE